LQQTHRNTLFQEGEGAWGIQTIPDFGIGPRALLVQAGKGNILWDWISLINPDAVCSGQRAWRESNPLTNINSTTCRRADDTFRRQGQWNFVLFDCELIVKVVEGEPLSISQNHFPGSSKRMT
jgi:hypothetical protein